MTTKKALLVCLELVVIVAVIGCAPTIVSNDAAVYSAGKMYARASKSIDAVYAATLNAMVKLELQVTDKAKDVFAAKVTAKSADGKTVVVKINPAEEGVTAYTVQVGGLGDETRVRKVYDEIQKGLR
jgi:hypothetical protein